MRRITIKNKDDFALQYVFLWHTPSGIAWIVLNLMLKVGRFWFTTNNIGFDRSVNQNHASVFPPIHHLCAFCSSLTYVGSLTNVYRVVLYLSIIVIQILEKVCCFIHHLDVQNGNSIEIEIQQCLLTICSCIEIK